MSKTIEGVPESITREHFDILKANRGHHDGWLDELRAASFGPEYMVLEGMTFGEDGVYVEVIAPGDGCADSEIPPSRVDYAFPRVVHHTIYVPVDSQGGAR